MLLLNTLFCAQPSSPWTRNKNKPSAGSYGPRTMTATLTVCCNSPISKTSTVS